MIKTAKRFVRAATPRTMRNWIKSPKTSAKWIWNDLKFAAGITENVEMRSGWLLKCHPAVYRGSYCGQHTDPEQVAEFDCFVRHARDGMVLFDLGAHFGLFSLATLHYGGQTARAIAVDPSPVAARIVRLQAGLNSVADRLQMIEASVGENTGWQSMVAVGVLANGYYVAPSPDHTSSEMTKTPTVTLDDLTKDCRVIPTHVKIDVEGFEVAVLRGGRDLLRRTDAPLLFLELHNRIIIDNGGEPEETIAILRESGYELFGLDDKPIAAETVLSKPLTRIVARK